jgi:hypothetical protein
LRTRVTVGTSVGVLLAAVVFGGPPAELGPLTFLLGEWRSAGAGREAQGTAVFARGLQDRVILRTSYAEYSASEGRPASRHDDLMVIYAGGPDETRADYFDSEGHVIRYRVSSPAAGEALFLSDALADQPRFRLRYRLAANGVLTGEFAIAPKGAPDAFKPYLTWEARTAPRAGK